MTSNTVRLDKSFQSPFERRFSSLLSPLEFFVHKQTTSGILLILFSVFAFSLSNSPWSELLDRLSLVQFGMIVNEWKFSLSIDEWISQGLMTLFFFVTGLELKREIIAGRMRGYKEIRMVFMAALGGILLPALFYYALNRGTAGQHGWAIPTATDTAFSIAILSLLARRVSIELTIFLTALAIFDDIGAIIIISFFYAHDVNMEAIGASIFILAFLFLVNRAGIRRGWIYAVLGILLWLCVLQSGIHPTLSGLLLAMTIPARASISQSHFITNIKSLLSRFEQKQSSNASMLGSSGKHTLVTDMGNNVRAASTPLQRWELSLIIPISIIILPLFALFNAGLPLSWNTIMQGIVSPVTLGIVTALVIGKPLGILLFSYIALITGLGRLPEGVRLSDIAGIAMLAGIGFTMSIFFTTLSFPQSHELTELAKLGIFAASILSALFGSLWIYFQSQESFHSV